ncbi:hypothetical protein CDEST_12433 [Colletotrichum destructivum]|uniref:Uncharacterized protein n=1 Tax=Colletotrichum destructivum TaxID=34406 RepID=A0AAX4IVV7_9PEZI|nr:hypothetical protein CDEST_12433 [Colletotrichum destructivum]
MWAVARHLPPVSVSQRFHLPYSHCPPCPCHDILSRKYGTFLDPSPKFLLTFEVTLPYPLHTPPISGPPVPEQYGQRRGNPGAARCVRTVDWMSRKLQLPSCIR